MDIIEVNDIVTVLLNSSRGSSDITFKLVEELNEGEEIKNVTVSSPLGQSVYGKTLNDSFDYKVLNNDFSGEIKNIIKPKILKK